MNIKQRNIVVAILLSLLTCGIYSIYWIVVMVKDAVSVKDADDSAVLEIVLSLFLFPVGLFLTEKKLAEGCEAKGIEHKDNSILYLIISFLGLGIVSMCLMQNDLNKIAEATPVE